MLHGENASDEMDQFHCLKNFGKKQKEMSKTNPSSKYKTSKEEIHAIVKKDVFQSIKNEKKQKHQQESDQISEELNQSRQCCIVR